MNPERLIGDAKALALSLAPRLCAGVPRTDIKVAGESGFALLKLGVWTMRQGHYISDHDVFIAEKLGNVLTGGRLTGEQIVSEQYLLDLEREAFLSLCGNPKTQERMAVYAKDREAAQELDVRSRTEKQNHARSRNCGLSSHRRSEKRRRALYAPRVPTIWRRP